MLVFLLVQAWVSSLSSTSTDGTALLLDRWIDGKLYPSPNHHTQWASWTEQEGAPPREKQQKRRPSPHSSALQTAGDPNFDAGELLAFTYFLQESAMMFSVIQGKKSRWMQSPLEDWSSTARYLSVVCNCIEHCHYPLLFFNAFYLSIY